MKKILTFFLVLSLFTSLPIFAQKALSSNACGTSSEDMHTIFDRMQENRARYGNAVQMRAVAYIPVALHLAAKTDGTGRISEARVLDYLAATNATYAANGLEMQFYIKYLTYINNDDFYDKPSSFASVNRSYSLKKRDALNIFFCNNLGDGSDPTVTRLGYYQQVAAGNDISYSADWVFIKNSEVANGTSSTLEHELGHFFSLNHTFYGFDDEPFVPTAASPCAPVSMVFRGRTVLVEKVDRTGANANCSTAGDGFCDTPADYNLGLGWPNCNYTGLAKDPTCIAVDPDETNMMGYFTKDCANKFSGQQKNAMRVDYLNTSQRKYLRDGNTTPSLVDMVAPTLQIPANNTVTTSFSNINFDWTDVEGVKAFEPNNASGYLFEISTFPSFLASNHSFRVPNSSFNLLSSNLPANYLVANKKYYWRVRPYSTYKTAFTYQPAFSFVTGTLNAVHDIEGIENFTLSPNPLLASQILDINLTSNKVMDAVVRINSIAGQVVLSQKMRFETGSNSKQLTLNGLNKGLYILTIEAENGVLNKKIIVAE